MRKRASPPVTMAFEKTVLRVAIADIQPLRLVSATIRRSSKYTQIAASMEEVGIVESPVVARDPVEPGKYVLLDGHLRIDILNETGATEVACPVATDDEAYCYNKHVNRLATVQEYMMIRKALDRGVPEERIAKALNVDVRYIVRKGNLLEGICSEAAELLRDKHVPMNAFVELRKMLPLRQIEAAQLMVAMNKYALDYAKSLLAATPAEQLVEPTRPKRIKGLTEEQMALMERESVGLEREFSIAEKSYGTDQLDLVIINAYVARLVNNAPIVNFLARNYREILGEFQKITDAATAAA
jgi:RepB plasmid partitioning protein/ParB-like nuclease domain